MCMLLVRVTFTVPCVPTYVLVPHIMCPVHASPKQFDIQNTSQCNSISISPVYCVILKGTSTLVPPYSPLFFPVNPPDGKDRKQGELSAPSYSGMIWIVTSGSIVVHCAL